MFSTTAIQRLIEDAIPGANAMIVDDANDGEHFSAVVVSEAFRGRSLVQQHQAIYQALGPRMGREIHALALTTLTPEQWAKKEQK